MFKEEITQYCKNCFELQQQLDQLKEQLEAYKMESEEGKEINAELKAENEYWKNKYEDLQETFEMFEITVTDSLKWQIDQYKQAIEKVKEISENVIKNVSDRCIETTPMYGVHKQILQICDEVNKDDSIEDDLSGHWLFDKERDEKKEE